MLRHVPATIPSMLRLGVRTRHFEDLYHRLMDAGWNTIFLAMTAVYLGVNAFFAMLYMSCGDCVENASGGFLDAFAFSVQTMATIGYGKMSPAGTFANLLVIAEAIAGTAANAVITGIIFSKFARPTARVTFSQVAVLSLRDGVPSLLFRMANERNNLIVETQLHAVLIQDEVTQEGEHIKRFHDLHFSRDRNLTFALTWTAIHPVVPGSPLHGLTRAQLKDSSAEIVVSLMGMDSTSSQTIYARHTYAVKHLLFNMRFVDILSSLPNGDRQVDYTRFHDVTAMGAPFVLDDAAPLGLR